VSGVEERAKNATSRPRGASGGQRVEKRILRGKLLKMTTQSIIVEERLHTLKIFNVLPCRGISKVRPQLVLCPSHQLRGFRATTGTAMSERRRGCMLRIGRLVAQIPLETRK